MLLATNSLGLKTPSVSPGPAESHESVGNNRGCVDPNPAVVTDCSSPTIGDKGTDWESIVVGNRLLGHGVTVGYSSPTIVNGEVEVVLEMDDIQSELDY